MPRPTACPRTQRGLPRCPGGGIGRRAGFRYLWPQGRGSSSLLLGTIRQAGGSLPAGSRSENTVSATQFIPGGAVHLHKHDLPETLDLGPVVAVDTETMGLNPHRDRLCLVQLSAGDGRAHLVQLLPERLGGRGFDCPNLKRLLADPGVVKLMHFARFDVAVLQHSLDITVAPVRCTKIAAKLVRTFTDRHGLKDLCKELLGVELSKQQQTSDWGAVELTAEQLSYAASDVLHLHALWASWSSCWRGKTGESWRMPAYAFLPARARLDLLGYEDPDIFAH